MRKKTSYRTSLFAIAICTGLFTANALKAQYTCPFKILNFSGCNIGVAWEVDRYVTPTSWQDIGPGCVGTVSMAPSPSPGLIATAFTLPLTCCPVNGGQDVFVGVLSVNTPTGWGSIIPTQGVNGFFPVPPGSPNLTGGGTNPATCNGIFTVKWYTNRVEIR